jgi:hypothetical protein
MHSANVVVYENDVDSLTSRLLEAQREWDPARVVKVFAESHSQLFRGDRGALADFFERVASGAIHSRLHLAHAGVGR